MDELADELLTSDRYCGIALPHLPKRDVLVSAGYLDGPRRSALGQLIEEQVAGDAEKFLEKLAESGNKAAQVALEERRKRKREAEEKEQKIQEQIRKDKVKDSDRHDLDRGRIHESRGGHSSTSRHHRGDTNLDERRRYENRTHDFSRSRREENTRGSERYNKEGRHGENEYKDRDREYYDDDRKSRPRNNHESHKSQHSSDKKYGTLFKTQPRDNTSETLDKIASNVEQENTAEYWNDQRAKLGLKPLQK
eukprot:CCRYP_012337-RA/>CCRYP_012337-RA protein AED:0.04 eAED:0.04 QI:554/1/1/1/0/0/2/63/250